MGGLYLAEWRQGFTVHELRALFFDCQQLRTLRRDLARLERERDELAAVLSTPNNTTLWYRHQLVLESHLGLALTRIAG